VANAVVFGLKSAPMQSIARYIFSHLLAAAVFVALALALTRPAPRVPYRRRVSGEPFAQAAAS